MNRYTGLTVSVLGRDYPVELAENSSDYINRVKFRVDLGDGQELSDPSFYGLENKAREFKDVRFELPVTTRDGRDAVITGFHAGSGNALVLWKDTGKRTQEAWYRLDGAMPRLSDADRAELSRLTRAREDAEKARKEFTEARQFADAKAAATEARARAAGIST